VAAHPQRKPQGVAWGDRFGGRHAACGWRVAPIGRAACLHDGGGLGASVEHLFETIVHEADARAGHPGPVARGRGGALRRARLSRTTIADIPRARR